MPVSAWPRQCEAPRTGDYCEDLFDCDLWYYCDLMHEPVGCRSLLNDGQDCEHPGLYECKTVCEWSGRTCMDVCG